MIKFDSSHTSVDGNLDKKQGKKLGRKILASGLIIANLFTFSACAKTMDCPVPVEHAHYYTNEENFGRYIISEKEHVDGLTRTDKYVAVSKESEHLLRYINRYGLYRIDENREAIQEYENSHQDYLEYKNNNQHIQPIPISPSGSSDVKFKFIPLRKDDWSKAPNENFTGETRECRYVYYGYKIVEKPNGGYSLERSEYVDSISDLPPEYEYVSQSFSTVMKGSDYDLYVSHNIDTSESVRTL